MGEDDFMGEEGNPLEGGGAVGGSAADEFVLAVGPSDESGLAELMNNAAGEALENQVF